MVLVADDGDRPGVLRPAQLLRGARGRQPATDDDDAPSCAHVGVSTRCRRPDVRDPAVYRVRPRTIDDVRQHHDALTAFHVGRGADPFQRLLEVSHVAGKHMQDRIRGPGDGGCADHLRDVDPCRPQLIRGDGAVAEHLHVSLRVPSECVAVDYGGESPDDAVVEHPVDPPLDRRSRQVHLLRRFRRRWPWRARPARPECARRSRPNGP